ncbi:hypothetical protein CQW23_27736 [Capsicum baccatum]|uniref:Uncharacterized protein n=1 Tax=Capsicum baccatum TaxID=33114 RepID=A0A2G2VEN9_CAPBA|nr:hypothetical protein CQW23_27736 [Capsicum baccatum]
MTTAYGISEPISTSGPTELDVFRNCKLEKNANSGTHISVKLVSEAGVEVIANVVVKGLMSLDGLTFRVSDFHEHQI